MDFISGFPRTPRHNEVIWVIMDRQTKSTCFIPLRGRTTIKQLAQTYFQEIVRLHGIPASIVSDRDSRFVSQFWKSLQRAMGTKLNFSMAYHPKLMGKLKELTKHLRICSELVLWISMTVGMSSNPWQNSPIIIAITLAFRWLLFKLFMAELSLSDLLGRSW